MSEFDPLVQQYIKLQHDGDAKAKGLYPNHMNDPPASRMSDFNHMPITQWPSVEAYDAFKEYYLASLDVLNTSVDVNKSINVQDRIGAYDGKLEALQKALNAARAANPSAATPAASQCLPRSFALRPALAVPLRSSARRPP